VGELLREMQERKVHIAIVVDEHGGTAGLVTFEDLIEEIVGPVRDEYDEAEQEEIQFISDREVLVSARVPIDDVKELLHLNIDDVDADSIGGLVYAMLGEIPKAGATISIGKAKLTVDSVRRQSIQSVRITSDTPFVREDNGDDDDDDEGTEPADEGDRQQTAAG
jgi:CBS domain containing-hemolysin-like protein